MAIGLEDVGNYFLPPGSLAIVSFLSSFAELEPSTCEILKHGCDKIGYCNGIFRPKFKRLITVKPLDGQGTFKHKPHRTRADRQCQRIIDAE